MNGKTKVSFRNLLGVLLAIDTVVYLFFILKVPQFIADDYYIFYVIRHHPSVPFILDFTEKYSLGARPISYCYLWFQHALFGPDSLSIKLFSLLLLLLYSGCAVITLQYVFEFLKVSLSHYVFFLAGLFISLHPDTMLSVLWISDVNELLMSLFYVLAALVFFAYATGRIQSRFVASGLFLTCYSFAVLSKQQSIHLPLLLLFFLEIYRNKFTGETYSILLKVLVVALVFLGISVLFNINMPFAHHSIDSMTITEILFKKPLAVMGNIVLIVLPPFGTEIYDFFIQNKIAAWICLTSILIAAAVIFSKRRTVLPSVLKISAFIIIISFPRMAAPGGNRLNTVLVVVIVSLVIALFQKSRKGILIALCILVISASYASVEMFSLLRASVRKHAALCKSLENYGDQYRIKYISYFSPEVPTSNSFYFFRYHAFGADSTVGHSGIVINDYRNWFAPTENVLCALSGDTLEIASQDPSMDIEWDEDFHPKVSASQRGSVRGYSKVSVIIPDTVYAGNAVILTPNGDSFNRVR